MPIKKQHIDKIDVVEMRMLGECKVKLGTIKLVTSAFESIYG